MESLQRFRTIKPIWLKYYLVIFLLYFIGCLYGLFIRFSPNYLEWKVPDGASWLIGFTICIPFLFDQTPPFGTEEKKHPIFGYLVTGLATTLITYFGLTYTVPAINTALFGTEFTTVGRVSEKSTGISGRTCQTILFVKDIFHKNYTYSICTSHSFWNSVERNQYLELGGKESRHGRNIKSFTKYNANNKLQPTAESSDG